MEQKSPKYEELLSENKKLKAQLTTLQNQKEIAENKLAKIEFLKNIFMATSHGVITFALDREYRYLAFTLSHKQTMKEIWGVDIEEGAIMLEYIRNKMDREKAKINFDRAFKGETFLLYEEYGDENFRRTFYENRYGPIYDNHKKNIIGLIVYVIDVTYQKESAIKLEKQVEEYTKLNNQYKLVNEKLKTTIQQLSASEEKFREMADFLPQIVYETDLNGTFTFINRKAKDFFGYTIEELKKFTVIELIAPEDRERAKKNVQSIIVAPEKSKNL